jgi:hypothetical protein
MKIYLEKCNDCKNNDEIVIIKGILINTTYKDIHNKVSENIMKLIKKFIENDNIDIIRYDHIKDLKKNNNVLTLYKKINNDGVDNIINVLYNLCMISYYFDDIEDKCFYLDKYHKDIQNKYLFNNNDKINIYKKYIDNYTHNFEISRVRTFISTDT